MFNCSHELLNKKNVKIFNVAVLALATTTSINTYDRKWFHRMIVIHRAFASADGTSNPKGNLMVCASYPDCWIQRARVKDLVSAHQGWDPNSTEIKSPLRCHCMSNMRFIFGFPLWRKVGMNPDELPPFKFYRTDLKFVAKYGVLLSKVGSDINRHPCAPQA